jgi:hypothetical protein
LTSSGFTFKDIQPLLVKVDDLVKEMETISLTLSDKVSGNHPKLSAEVPSTKY